jgi:hypothetical protein
MLLFQFAIQRSSTKRFRSQRGGIKKEGRDLKSKGCP